MMQLFNILVLILVLLFGALGCDDNNKIVDTTALTENDFAADSTESALAGNEFIVTFLEDPESQDLENDTGTVGVDVVTITYPEAVEQTICWLDEDDGAVHIMELVDSTDNVVFTVEANGECVTKLTPAGDYTMVIYHDGRTEDDLQIFIVPNPEKLTEASNNHGVIDNINIAAANVLNYLGRYFYEDARAQIFPTSLGYLLSTNQCNLCTLQLADLSGANLAGAVIIGSNLSAADLSGANLSGANIIGSDMRDAVFAGANLSGASVSFSNLIRADFTGANLNNASLLGSNLDNSNLNGANLIGTNLSLVSLGDAEWCDGCKCSFIGSIGTCLFCEPQDTCTGS